MQTTVLTEKEVCEYCNGQGYYQLLLGGSETCPSCQGSGKKKGTDR
ncbi:MAG: YuiA family protein [Bacillaceae bacterium]|nr:YuiA family protein [Bacillaceae bacterium]